MTTGKIYVAMAKVMAEAGAVAKSRNNEQQRYKFRGVDDVYQALQKIMASHGVISIPTVLEERTEERTTKSGTALIYRVLKIKYTFYAEDGSSIESVVIGEGMDSGDKASNKAMSVADKYCLLQAFKIPTEDAKDPEVDSVHDKEGVAPKRQGTNPEPYDNVSAHHRARFLEITKKAKIKPAEMPALAKACIGIPLVNLEAAVNEWAAGPSVPPGTFDS